MSSSPPSLLRSFRTVGRDLFLQGLNSSRSGNLSVREGENLWITRRGASLGRIGPRDLVRIALGLSETTGPEPSSELPSHLAIYQNPGAKAVVHAHPPAAIALSLSRTTIEPVDLEGTFYMPRVTVVVPDGPYDPHRLADPVGQALRSANVAVIRGHGTFSWGADLSEALHWASALEHSCRILLLSGLDRS